MADNISIKDGANGDQTIGTTEIGGVDFQRVILADPSTGAGLTSVPVTLAAGQVVTLTPPAAITGYATAAKQPALGTAGTPSADVLTVQGSATGTALPVTDPDAAPANCWAVAHAPAANTKATILKAATAAKRHVCTSLTVTLAAGSTAPSAVQVGVSLIQDAAGTPVTLWAAVLSLQAVAGDRCGVTKPCYIPTASVNQSLTLEFSAAGGANTIEAVAMEGITLAV